MLRHVVLFTWKQDATQASKDALAAELRKLPGVIDSIRGYRTGPDVGVNPANSDFAVVADFDDVDGYLAYRDHPAHRAVVERNVAPILASRSAVQFEI